MPRMVVTVVVFFIVFNAMGGVLISQGVAADLGLDTRVSQDCPISDENILDSSQEVREQYPDCQSKYTQAQQIETGTGLGDTLFGMYNTVAQSLSTIYEFLFGGLVLLERAGTPEFITKGILLPAFSVIVTVEIGSLLLG